MTLIQCIVYHLILFDKEDKYVFKARNLYFNPLDMYFWSFPMIINTCT